MSLRIPLTVRLAANPTDVHVTRDIRDLTIAWSDPGGYTTCRIALDRPIETQPDEIAYYGTLTVYDARSAEVVWDGRLEDPGRSAGTSGQVWDIAAVGGQAHARDRIVPLVYIDRPMSGMERVDNATPGGRDEVGADPGDAAGARQAIVLQFPPGQPVVGTSRVTLRYSTLMRTGQRIGRIDYQWDGGQTSTNLRVDCTARTDGNLASGSNVRSDNISTAGGPLSPRMIVTNWSTDRNTIDWRLVYVGVAGTVTTGDNWASIRDIMVQPTRFTAAGSEQLTAAPYANNFVLASEVVADLLGRLLTGYNGTGATIATTTHQIEQLAYPDGVDAYKVLTDLLALESGHTWRVWERNVDGKYRFEFVALPTEVRYEATAVDGYDAPGSADGLYNAVMVRWKDSTGVVQTTIRTASVPILTAAGLTRQGSLDLGADVGSLADAQKAGDAWLADRASPPNGGRLTIGRPILDITLGRMVQPWEIRPGLIRVRGIAPRPDALNPTGRSRDGVTIFRLVSGEYRASSGAVVLELDSYAPSTARALANLALRANYPRR